MSVASCQITVKICAAAAILLSSVICQLSTAEGRYIILDMDKLEKDIKVDGTIDEGPMRATVSRLAYNPEAAEFRNTVVNKGTGDFPVLCGEVNIVNHEAGSNWQRFVHAGDPVLEEQSGFERKWKKHCEQ